MATKDAKRARTEEARRRSEENLALELRRSRIQNAVVVAIVLVAIGLFAWAAIAITNSADEQPVDADLELDDSGELTVPSAADDFGGIRIGCAAAAGVPQRVIDRIEDGEFTRYVGYAGENASIAGVRGAPTTMFDRQIAEIEWRQAGQLGANVLYYLEQTA